MVGFAQPHPGPLLPGISTGWSLQVIQLAAVDESCVWAKASYDAIWTTFANVIWTEIGVSVSVEVEVGSQDNPKREGGMHGVGLFS